MGVLAMVTLLTAAAPEPALLEALGARALQLESFTEAAQLTLEVHAEELDAAGAVSKTTQTTMRVTRAGGKAGRTLLHHEENGKDLTEDKRAELERPPKKAEAAVRSPFHPAEQRKYRFVMLPPPREAGLLRVGFQPAGEKDEALSIGDATVDPVSGDTVALSMRPSKNPLFVEALSIECAFEAQTPAGRALSKLSIKGIAGLLFFKKRFRVVTTLRDYEGP